MKIEKFNEAFKKLLGVTKQTIEVDIMFVVTEHRFDKKLYNIQAVIPKIYDNFIATGIKKEDIEIEKNKFLTRICNIHKNIDKYNL